MNPEESPKFVAVLDEAREVSLLGLADAVSWARRLHPVDLQVAKKEGRAQVLLSAVEARYMGMPFRELAISVYVRHPAKTAGDDCLYLAHAFHSSRLLAFVGRAFLHTPCYPARVEVETQLPVSFAASCREGHLLRATMDRDTGATREPIRSGHDDWEGRIFLPQIRAKGSQRRRWFSARLAGDTYVYAFFPGRDEVAITPSEPCQALQVLAESNFDGREWIVRESALHARSKTYAEAEVLSLAKVEAPALETPG